MAPATNSETAATRRMRRTRMRSAATSGAGGHEAPPGHLATSSAWTSAALERPLIDGVGGHQTLAHGGHGQIGLRQEETDVQVGPCLDLERGLLAVVEERRREPEPPAVLVDHLGGGARTGEEAGVEVGELGYEGPSDDDARRTGIDGGPRGVEGVLAVDHELCVCDGPRARGAACPGCRQTVTTEGPPDATRGDRPPPGRAPPAARRRSTTVTTKRENHVAA